MNLILIRLGIFIILLSKASLLTADEKANVETLKKLYQRPGSVPYLENNAYSKARERLGWNLFFDPRLSGSGVMSCASCHNPSLAWGDGLPKGIGHDHKALSRRTPSILNLAWTNKMMWDGRFSQLEGQALGPIVSEAEMNMNPESLIERLKAIPGYVKLFTEAYPDEDLSQELVAKALAVYERGIVSGQAPFDRWVTGNVNAMSKDAVKGFVLFNGKAKCSNCHSGWRFTDDSFHDLGLKSDDIGRGKYLKLSSQQYAFKTPGLRNISQRAPYMHDGSKPTLAEVIEFYDRGGDVKRDSLSGLITPLQLTAEEKKQLEEFLRALTSQDKAVELPVLPQ